MANEMDDKKLCMGCMRMRKEAKEKCPYCGFDEKKGDREDNEALPLRTVLNGKYLLGKPLGRGGFGITYIAYEKNLQIRVAIKEFFPWSTVKRDKDNSLMPVSWKEDSEFFETDKKKVLDEARRMAQLMDLPGVVFVRDFFEENNTAYIVMEYLDGMTLSKYLSSPEGSISPEWVLKAMKPVLASLAKVHKAGIIHRDISPDNMILTSNNTIKLIDFGAARNYSESRKESLSVILKRGYAPIEQYSSRGNQGPWTDIYALCATMYKMMTGSAPLESTDRIINDEIKSIRGMEISLAPKLEKAVMKGLSINYKDRFSNIYELYTALYGKLTAEVISAKEAYDTARELYDEKRYEEATPYLKVAADAANSIAMYMLGDIYSSSEDASVNYSKAIKWLKKAIDAGSVSAINKLGDIYRNGNRTFQDYDRALELYNMAANRNNSKAMNNLGDMYRYGYGVTQNYDRAIEWYQKAADANLPEALKNLGDMYRYGQGFPKDNYDALSWYKKAAENGSIEAMICLGDMYYHTDEYRWGLKAAEWYLQAANCSNTYAMYQLGTIYRSGMDGLESNFNYAMYWLTKAAEAGNIDSMCDLGWIYARDTDIQDGKLAMKLFMKAAKNGNSHAMYGIGAMYHEGLGIPQDVVKGIPWYKKAADAGREYAMETLGDIYRCGDGVAQDINFAVEWYKKAIDAGSLEAGEKLGDMYYYGKDVPQNYNSAFEFYSKAAAYSEYAMEKLGDMYRQGNGVPQNIQCAVTWYTEAALVNVSAMEKLGDIYYNGEGVLQDYTIALKWYEKAVEWSSYTANIKLGNMYRYGIGVNKNSGRALDLYAKAYVQEGILEGIKNIKDMCLKGEGVPHDYEHIVWFCTIAARSVDELKKNAMNILGYMYHNGYGVVQDIDHAIELYKIAADKGNPDALHNLETINKAEKNF